MVEHRHDHYRSKQGVSFWFSQNFQKVIIFVLVVAIAVSLGVLVHLLTQKESLPLNLPAVYVCSKNGLEKNDTYGSSLVDLYRKFLNKRDYRQANDRFRFVDNIEEADLVFEIEYWFFNASQESKNVGAVVGNIDLHVEYTMYTAKSPYYVIIRGRDFLKHKASHDLNENDFREFIDNAIARSHKTFTNAGHLNVAKGRDGIWYVPQEDAENGVVVVKVNPIVLRPDIGVSHGSIFVDTSGIDLSFYERCLLVDQIYESIHKAGWDISCTKQHADLVLSVNVEDKPYGKFGLSGLDDSLGAGLEITAEISLISVHNPEQTDIFSERVVGKTPNSFRFSTGPAQAAYGSLMAEFRNKSIDVRLIESLRSFESNKHRK